MRSGRQQAGFTFVAMLIAVAALGAGLAATGEIWAKARQREAEEELLFVGSQIRQAIALYYHRTPGSGKQYPETLEDLLHDRRHPTPQRYLRKAYADPLTGKYEWGLVKTPDGRISGVYSLSGQLPLKVSGFSLADRTFEGATHYSDWRFLHEPQPL